MPKNIFAHLAIITANVFYAANYTVAKWVMPKYIKPFGFIFIRVAGAVLFFWLISIFIKEDKLETKDFIRLFFCGIFGVAINQLFFFKGLDLTTPVNASLMMITTPIMVVVIAILAKKEMFTWLKTFGILLGATGAFLLLLGKEFSFNSSTSLGNFFVFINAVSYSIYLTIVKPLMNKYKPIQIVKWVFLFGFIPVFFVSFPEFKAIEWHTFETSTWLSLFFVVFAVTCLAYLFNIYALSIVNPSVVGIYIYLQPLLATFFAILMKADTLNWIKISAAALICLGVYFVSFHKNKKLINA
ncbi:MAG: DMT family transporter [Chitinophagales bacterium]